MLNGMRADGPADVAAVPPLACDGVSNHLRTWSRAARRQDQHVMATLGGLHRAVRYGYPLGQRRVPQAEQAITLHGNVAGCDWTANEVPRDDASDTSAWIDVVEPVRGPEQEPVFRWDHVVDVGRGGDGLAAWAEEPPSGLVRVATSQVSHQEKTLVVDREFGRGHPKKPLRSLGLNRPIHRRCGRL